MADYAIHDTTLTDISNVIRKKEGSSALIDPADYADRINLMGMLEEKTQASAPVCSFEDGADAVPLKNWLVTLPASLDGYSEVNGTQTGKSVFLPMDIEQGTISESGYNSNSTARIRTADRKAVTPSTEYKIKVNSEVQIYEVHEYTDLTGSSTHLTVNASEYTFTTKSTTNFLRILFRYSNNATIKPSAITELQVTDENLFWETHTASLGRTIYGGTADIVNGTGQATFARIDLGSLIYTHRNNVGMQSNGISSLIQNPPDNYTKTTAIASDYTSDTWQIVMNSGTSSGLFGVSGGYVCFSTTETDPDAFKASMSGKYLVYPLATPTDFTFTPITPTPETALGVNNFWADEGDTEVTYRASGTVYNYPTGEEASF